MIRRMRLDTVLKKYAFGYVLAMVLLLLSFGAAFGMLRYLDKSYASSTQKFALLNDLESAAEAVNQCVGIGYDTLMEDNLQPYPELKGRLEGFSSELSSAADGRYVRENEDLLCTLESYLETTDRLVETIMSFEVRDLQSEEIVSLFSETQEMYGYVSLRFQDAYGRRIADTKLEEKRFRHLRRLLLVVFTMLLAGSVMICSLYLFRVIGGVSRAINRVVEAARHFQNDPKNTVELKLDTNDEFDELASAFNRMQDIIRKQICMLEETALVRERLAQAENDNLRMYGALQKSHLAFLQSRINPHFLFNTLNMISAQAEIEGAEKSAELMRTAAAYLRYNLDNIHKTVTLKQEIDNLNDYIAIQRSRYGDRFTFTYDVEAGCLCALMPCMILQPLVENSIRHGIGMMTEGGTVLIRGYSGEERLILEVSDNGIGMSEEQIRKVLEEASDLHATSDHIGLRNIFGRLRYHFHDNVVMNIIPGQPGVTIQLVLPFSPGGKHETDNGHSG